VSHWLGHASINTTNRYAAIDLEMKRQALARMHPWTAKFGWDFREIGGDEKRLAVVGGSCESTSCTGAYDVEYHDHSSAIQ
jgi:hypothetical protein